MTTYGEVARPQGVFVGYSEEDPKLRAMTSMIAGHTLAKNAELRGHRPRDFDLAVQRAQPEIRAASHLHLLMFGCSDHGPMQPNDRHYYSSLNYAGSQPSRTITVNTKLSDRLRGLVQQELVPWLLAQNARPVLFGRASNGHSYALNGSSLNSDAVPFVLDADNNVIAGAFRRSHEGSFAWVLPHDPEHPEVWLAEFLRQLHSIDPERFPEPTPWRTKAAWMSGDELAAQETLDALDARNVRWERAFRERKTSVEAHLLHAATAADAGLRRLLTAQGDELTEAVAHALADLGFTTTDEDAERDGGGMARAHDLNVVNPDRPAEVIIVEVKGTARGALMQAQQHILRYTARHRQQPDRCWLIINHLHNRPPDERPLLLQGANDDIAVFAQAGGVLIDTKDLFHLVKRVTGGTLTSEKARAILTTRVGRLDASLVQG